MIVLEGVTFLVLQEDAGHVARGEGIVVAIGSQIASMQGLEVMLLCIDLFKEIVAAHAFVADLAILHGAVVANHIYIKEVLNLT